MVQKTKYERRRIGKEAAIALGESEWWKDKTPREIAGWQLFVEELAMPFGVFHEAVEKSLERPVWTHEFALNYDGIVEEFLGRREPPTMQDIIDLSPVLALGITLEEA